MQLKYIPFILFLCCANIAIAQTNTVEVDGIKVKFTVIDYGIGKANTVRTELDTASPTLRHLLGNNFIISQKTDKIPAELGTEFGVNYSISANTDSPIIITKVWIFPSPMYNPNLEKKFKNLSRSEEVSSNYSGYTIYKFEEYFEMLKGQWVLQFFYKDQLLLSKSFFVY